MTGPSAVANSSAPKLLQATPRPTYLLGMLMAAMVISLLDRQILSLLVEPVRHDLALTDTQISLLHGFAFAIFYAFMGLPLGYLVDRVNRRNLIIAGMALWSFSTIWCGLARSFEELFVARMAVGMGEACLGPAGFSMLSDAFSRERRGRALGLFQGAGNLGIAASLFLGSLVLSALGAASVVNAPVLGPLESWRVVFILAGLPGLLIALLLFTANEPARMERSALEGAAVQGLTLISSLRGETGAFVRLMAVFCLTQLAGYGYMSWMAAAYVRTFGVSVPFAGLICGCILLAGAVLGSTGGGWLGDRWSNRRLFGGRLRVAVLAGFVGATSVTAWWLSDNLALSVVFGCITYSCGAAVAAIAPTCLSELTPNELRGRVSAVYLMLQGMLGISLGPTAIALINDYLFRDPTMLRYSIIAVACPALLGVGVIALVSLRSYSQSIERRRREFQPFGSPDAAPDANVRVR